MRRGANFKFGQIGKPGKGSELQCGRGVEA